MVAERSYLLLTNRIYLLAVCRWPDAPAGPIGDRRSMLVNSHVVVAVSLLFSLGSVLLATAFAPLPAIATLVGCAGSILLLIRNGAGKSNGLLAQRLDCKWLGACLLIAFVLSVIGGQGHFFFVKDDWLIRDAVLADLVDRWLPAIYAHEGENWILRAPLGMYLPPAGIGHLFGLYAAHLALLVQTSIILGGFFYVSTCVWPRRRLAFLLLFVLFSGVDVIPTLMKTGGEWLPRYLFFWAEWWSYDNNVANLFWTPNHALPGWWFAALALLYLNREIDLAALAAATIPLVLWSPITLMGAVPIFALLAITASRSEFSLRFLGACGVLLGFAPVLVYLGIDAAAVPHEWLIVKNGFFDEYSVFISFALPQAVFALIFYQRIDPWFRTTLLASITVLFLIPLYSLGFMNDLSQRASIVPLALVAFGFNSLLIDFLTARNAIIGVAATPIALLAAVSPALELYDSVTTPPFAPSACNLATVNMTKFAARDLPSTYFAHLDSTPDWLFRDRGDTLAPIRAKSEDCWPGRIYGEKKFNWLKAEHRIWLGAPQEANAQADSVSQR
jgi:hypothetical protein